MKFKLYVISFSKDSLEKLCAAILLTFQWQKEKLQEVLFFLGPGLSLM